MGRSRTFEYDEFEDAEDYKESKKQIECSRNRRKQRRLKSALKSKDIDSIMEYDENY